MNQEDYSSDSDASDEDFHPDNEEQNAGSELESDEEKVEESNEESTGTKRKRRKGGVEKKKAKISKKPDQDSEHEELDEEEEKKRTDALWASFLGGEINHKESPSNIKGTSSAGNGLTKVKLGKPNTKVSPVPISAPIKKDKPTVAQLFEFAGEQIVLTEGESSTVAGVVTDDKPIGNPILSTVSKPSSPQGFPRRTVSAGGGGGLGAVLNQINKKNKLTVLEKTKLDWTGFKRQEGITEELQTHNKGKDGFLERRDFLERTDVRQFEIEKSLRQTKRSNR